MGSSGFLRPNSAGGRKAPSLFMIFSLFLSMFINISFPLASNAVPAGNNAMVGLGMIASGGNHTVVAKLDGTVWTWGYNSYGQLGINTTESTSVPVRVKGQGGIGYLTGVTAATAGEGHSLALKSDGTVWSWGRNYDGQLGNGTLSTTYTPVQVKDQGGIGYLTDVTAIAAGEDHSVALKSDGTVWSWGDNYSGMLGNGTKVDTSTPVQASSLTDVVAIAAGDWHTLALDSTGTVWAWGWGGSGQLGDGIMVNWNEKLVPAQVKGPGGSDILTDVVAVASGEYHSIAVKSDGTVWAWGKNEKGQLGDGTITNRSTPVQVTGLTDAVAVAAGYEHSLALKSDGTVWAWGDNYSSQIGDGTWTDTYKPTPVQVVGLTNTVAIAAGDSYSVALSSNGAISLWGDNYYGQLGNGMSGVAMNTLTPAQVKGPGGSGFLSNVSAIDAVGDYSLAVKSDGTIWSWGHNNYGQLGNGTNDNTPTPGQIPGLTDISMVASSVYYSLAVKSDQTVWTWGYATYGDPFFGMEVLIDTSTPVQVLGITDVTITAAGEGHCLALKTDGTLWAWGDNSYGQLGDDTWESTSTPVQVFGLSNVTATSAGYKHSIALDSTGTVWAWGNNYNGQLGDGTSDDTGAPVSATGLTDVIAISAGAYHSLALDSSGTVWAWGYNGNGQLGDGTKTDTSTPLQVTGLTNVVAIAAGEYHSLAVKSDGTVWAWGYNDYGQLGDGTKTDTSTAVQVAGLDSVKAVVGGEYHSLAIKSDGTAWAWGDNSYGQLGTGVALSAVPVSVGISIADTDAPTWPENATVTASGITETTLTLSWSEATDTAGVTAYKILKDGSFADTVTASTTTYTATGLSPATSYTFKIEAADAAGNWSDTGPSLVVGTIQLSSGPGGSTSSPTVTPDTTSTAIDPGKESVIQDGNGRYKLTIPAGAIEAEAGSLASVSVSEIAKASVEQLLKDSVIPEGFKSIGTAFEFKAEAAKDGSSVPVTTFTAPVKFEVKLTDEDLAGITDPGKVGMFKVNDSGTLTFIGGKLVDGWLVVEMSGFSKYVLAEVSVSFNDIGAHWAKSDIELMAAKYVVKGTPGGKFDPSGSVTRAQFAAMLVRAMNVTGRSDLSFTDVATSDWFYAELEKAVKSGIITGYQDGTFRPNAPVTREQAAVMLARALVAGKKADALSSDQAKSVLGSFVDHGQVSAWASADIALAVQKGIVNGTKADTLAPQSGASRAEAAVMIARYWQK